MKKWFAVMLFGITLMLFAVACAVLGVTVDYYVFIYPFFVFAAISLIVSIVALVMICFEGNKSKTDEAVNKERETKTVE